MNTDKPTFYRPQSWYWRRALMLENDPEKLRAHALALVGELELHKREFRANGLMPPKGVWAPGEFEAKATTATENKESPRIRGD